jgi:hypothetical protein
MNVIDVATGTDVLPSTLAANTIYVLDSGNHITSQTINLNTCSAIVGKDKANLYGSQQIANAMLYASSKRQIIIDDIKLDGKDNGQ